MPISDCENIKPVMHVLDQLQPTTILDIGCGTGLYGVLIRQYLEIPYGRLQPESWRVTLIGVEGHEPYHNFLHAYYYNMVAYETVTTENVFKYNGYDAVLLLDVLEHMPHDEAIEILIALQANNKNLIISWPTDFHEQSAKFNNELEKHISHFEIKEFKGQPFYGNVVHKSTCVVMKIKGI